MIMSKVLEIRIINSFNDRGSVVSNVVSTIGIGSESVECGKPLPFRLMDGSFPSVEYYDGEYLELDCGGRRFCLRAGAPFTEVESAVVPDNIHVRETKEIEMRLLAFSPVKNSDFRGMFRRGSVNSIVYNFLSLASGTTSPGGDADIFFRMVFWSRENMFLLDASVVDMLKTAAVNGNPAALFGYGRYALAVRRQVDWADVSAQCFREAASRGFADALAELSLVSRFGDLGVVDYAKADGLMDSALKAGSEYAWRVHLMHLIYGSRGVEKDPGRALSEAGLLVERDPDNPWWHWLRGDALFQTGDAEAAVADFEFAAEGGLREAWSDLAMAAGCNADLEITDPKAYEAALRRGAESRSSSCIWALATMKMGDCEGEPDYSVRMKARRYMLSMEEVFSLGNTLGAISLGDLYAEGEFGSAVDLRKAWGWYAKAAQLGSPDAYERMYRMMLLGQVNKDRSFRDMCALYGVRLGSDRLLREVMAALRDGGLSPYRTEIEKYYAPLLEKLEQEGSDNLDIYEQDNGIAGASDPGDDDDCLPDDDGRYDAYV